MKNWNKKPVTKQEIEPLCQKFGIDKILASILVRRGITDSRELLFYLEDALRFQHEPFCFDSMEDAVERILQAQEEGEKVFIFGDKDVDGVTSTTILYEQLVRMGIDVEWKVPLGEDAYGLSVAAVDEFATNGGTLIITVDCGISCVAEVDHANELGIDVIITDHHNPPEVLPQAIVIIDPKMPDCGYPYPEISGAAIAYKLVTALRFSKSDFYNAEICILEISDEKEDGSVLIEGVKIKNLVKVKELKETIVPLSKSIYDTKLLGFLQGQVIYAWDSVRAKNQLKNLFGSGIDFNLNDLRAEISKVIPSVQNKTAAQLTGLSHFSKYSNLPQSDINSLYNLYITYCKKVISQKNKNLSRLENLDLQLVGIAAIADIMPLKNENRIFIKNAISSIKKDGLRPGLAELFAKLKINKDSITSTSLSWNITPVLNAPGRLGQADLAVRLLTSTDGAERMALSEEICALNEKRKKYVADASSKVHGEALKSFEENNHKICCVIDDSINRGVTGNFAGKLMQEFGVPAIAITFNDEVCTGSMRSCRKFISTKYLESFGENFFINFGGHNYAAGFSFEKSKTEEFLRIIRETSKDIILENENEAIEVDAEIPPEYLTPDLFKLLDTLEPFGNENATLQLMTKKIKVSDAMVLGKKEPYTLKMILECGKFKFPALLWNQAERLKKDIFIGEIYDILYNINWNYFNGNVTPQLEIIEIRKSN